MSQPLNNEQILMIYFNWNIRFQKHEVTLSFYLLEQNEIEKVAVAFARLVEDSVYREKCSAQPF